MQGRTAVTRPATYEDLCQVPDHKVAEILDGELIVSPRPAIRHARASSRLGGILDGPFDLGSGGPGGWWILDEPELHLRDDILVPDLAGWRHERLPFLPDAAYLTLAPDWACEVISPSTERIDRSRKMRIYAREGVRHLWLLDPLVRTLEVLRLEDARWVVLATHGDRDVVRAEPFDAIEIDLATLLARPACRASVIQHRFTPENRRRPTSVILRARSGFGYTVWYNWTRTRSKRPHTRTPCPLHQAPRPLHLCV